MSLFDYIFTYPPHRNLLHLVITLDDKWCLHRQVALFLTRCEFYNMDLTLYCLNVMFTNTEIGSHFKALDSFMAMAKPVNV